MHLKRQRVPKNWPIPRKGRVFVVRPSSDLNRGLPVLVVLRDILGVAQTRKEVKKAIHEKNILLNNSPVKDDKTTALLFDVIKIVPAKKSYRIEMSENGKFSVNEIPEKESHKKFVKIVDKKVLKKKKTQLNLSDGRNIMSDLKCKTNDSIVVNLENGKIEKHLPLKEKSNAFIFEGKHAGKKGKIEKIKPERKMAEIVVDKKPINVLIKQFMAVE